MHMIYERFKRYAIVRGALLCAMGILTLLFPQFLLNAVVYVLAGYVILNGILSLSNYFRKEEASMYYFDFIIACLLIATGIVMAVFFRRIVSILPVFLGLLTMLEGTAFLVNALCAAENRRGILAFLAVFIVLGGVVAVLITFGGLVALSRVFGVLLLVSCVYELTAYFTKVNYG